MAQRKKENQMADNETLGHSSILGESKRTNRETEKNSQTDEGTELRDDAVPEAKEMLQAGRRSVQCQGCGEFR